MKTENRHNANIGCEGRMIVMHNEQIEKLRCGELRRYLVGRLRNWRPGTIHQIKTSRYGRAVAYAKVIAIRDAGDWYELELEKASSFDYLKQTHPDYMQVKL